VIRFSVPFTRVITTKLFRPVAMTRTPKPGNVLSK
jgi:hypothetical protein